MDEVDSRFCSAKAGVGSKCRRGSREPERADLKRGCAGMNDATRLLVECALLGDLVAIEALCKIYRKPLLGYLRHRRLAAQDAEDVAQETLMRMADALPKGRIRAATFEGWLFKTAEHVRCDNVRESLRAPETGIEPDRLPAASDEAAAAVERFCQEVLDGAIPLREPQREVLLMRLRGQEYAAIAKELGITRNAAYQRIHSAKRWLMKLLEKRL